MTAINIVCSKQHNRIYIASDAAAYDARGVVGGFVSKVIPMPQWPGALAVRGRGVGGPVIAYMLALNFYTFDDVVDHIETTLPAIVSECKIEGHVELLLAGFSEERDRPESYVIETSDAAPVGTTDEQVAAAEYLPDAYVLQRLPDIVSGPVATQEVVEAARFTGFGAYDEPEVVIAGLETLLEMQRHSVYGDGIYWVGGWGQLTTITPQGIEQRIMQRWPEDQIGELIQPVPIANWTRWRTERIAKQMQDDLGPAVALSRVRREMAERKARKARIR